MYQRKMFLDRTAEHPNRRRITIIEQSANEIIANIEPVSEEITQEGTALNAALMNEFQNSIIESEAKSQEALTIATQAKTQSQEAYNHVVEKQGTKVLVNDNFVTIFNADEKVGQSEFEKVTTSPIMTKISYDATTDTFSI